MALLILRAYAGYGSMFMFATLISPDSLESIWLALNAIDPQYALLVVFFLLFLAGCGLPLPEDIPLTFTGILLGLPAMQARYGGLVSATVVVGVVCYTSIITGDLVAHWLGRRYGRSISKYPPFRWAMPEHRIQRLHRWFDRFGNATVFFGRMVAGIRFVTFVVAGMAGMPVSRFIFWDSLAALITVPAWIILGYVVGTHFQQIVEWMSTVSTTTWIVVGTLIVAFFIFRLVTGRRRRKARAVDSPGSH